MVKYPGWKYTRTRFYKSRVIGYADCGNIHAPFFKCQICKGEFLKPDVEIHHLNPVKYRPDLVHRFENMIILCRKCHVKIHHDIEYAEKISDEFQFRDLCIEPGGEVNV